jgi:hypothetical protein
MDGPSEQVIAAYINSVSPAKAPPQEPLSDAPIPEAQTAQAPLTVLDDTLQKDLGFLDSIRERLLVLQGTHAELAHLDAVKNRLNQMAAEIKDFKTQASPASSPAA